MNCCRQVYTNCLRRLRNENGQTIVEYALIIVLIVIVVMVMFKGIGQNSNKAFSTINATLT